MEARVDSPVEMAINHNIKVKSRSMETIRELAAPLEGAIIPLFKDQTAKLNQSQNLKDLVLAVINQRESSTIKRIISLHKAISISKFFSC